VSHSGVSFTYISLLASPYGIQTCVCFEPIAVKYGIIFFVYVEDNLYLTYLVSYDLGTVSEFHVVACNVWRIFFELVERKGSEDY
jgi:hypothetical protein